MSCFQKTLQKIAFLWRLSFSFFLESLFPIRCVGCKATKVWLCSHCFQKIPRLSPSLLLLDPKRAPHQSLNGVISATPFHTPIVSRLIHLYKYAFVEDLKMPLGRLLCEALLRTSLPLPHHITFVPLHPRRLRMRGFNQAKLLSEELVSSLNDPAPLFQTETLLKRIRYTHPQIHTRSREERLRNLTNAFRLHPSAPSLSGKTVWIVDDVATTLTTLEECAHILKAAGAKEVYGVTLAR